MSAPTPRTTSALVQGIITVQDGVDLTPFIAIANELTTDVCTYISPNIPYTDGFIGSRMELIERWLAAHFYTIFDNQLTSAKAGTVAVGYQYKVDYGLKSSMYGQNAMRLDTLGGLAQLDNASNTMKKVNLSGLWLGRRHWRGDCYNGDLIED